MRKVAFVSLDDVMQAPGGPQEDPTLRARRRSTRHPASFDAVKKQVADLFNGITRHLKCSLSARVLRARCGRHSQHRGM